MQISGTSPIDAYTQKWSTRNQEKTGAEEGKQAEQKEDKKGSSKELSTEQEQQVEKLKNRDREVKAHEAAHQAAGAGISGGASYSYQTGPDGRRYAIGGEVSIDVSKEKTPEATISKMRKVKSAAMAPADPSSQDRSIASKADAAIRAAQQKIAQEARQQQESNTGQVAKGQMINIMA